MTTSIPVAVAPNFHLRNAPAGRVLLADGTSWRPMSKGERSAVATQSATQDERNDLILLFALPGHLRSGFWYMLEHGETAAGFEAFAAEVGQFLAFKQLPPPERAAVELVLHGAAGTVDPHCLWAIINLGDAPVLVAVPGLRVCLESGEGARLPQAVTAEIVPPDGDAPHVLLLVRQPVLACRGS
jgi:hypothetical protein